MSDDANDKALSLVNDTLDLAAANGLSDEQRKEIVIQSFGDIVANVVSEAQFIILSGKTPRSVIKTRPGKGGKTFKYVPHGYVVSVLNKAFGFDWDFENITRAPDGRHYIVEPEITGTIVKRELDKGATARARKSARQERRKFSPEDRVYIEVEREVKMRPASVIVHGVLTIRIRDPQDPSRVIATIRKSATGEKEVIRGMTWGALVKSAESDALKKSASKFGVALDLYWQDADDDYIDDDGENEAIQVISAAEMTARETYQSMLDTLSDGDTITPRDLAAEIITLISNGEIEGDVSEFTVSAIKAWLEDWD